MAGWLPISDAQSVRYGTIADLRMENGRVYRCEWDFRGNACAWWPLDGQARRAPIGLYSAKEFRIVADGLISPHNWRSAIRRSKAILNNNCDS